MSQLERIQNAIERAGLGALLLVVLSGLIWFILWRNGSSFSGLPLETHKNVTPLIDRYLTGHGRLALLHSSFWLRNKARQLRHVMRPPAPLPPAPLSCKRAEGK